MKRRGRPKHPDILTPRQWEVLALLREGLTNEAIAQRMAISPDGTKFHVSEILGKLGVTSREEAARWRREDRPWWTGAAAPLLFWRKLASGWLAATIVGGLAVTISTGLGLLIWGLTRTAAGPESAQPGALMHTLVGRDAAESDNFGQSVALVGNDVLVGAYQDDTGALDTGAAYLFDGDSGDLLRTFLNPNPRENDQFGWSVAAVGDRVVVGARLANVEETHSGAAYLFDRDSGDLLQTLPNPSPAFNDHFGSSVAALGDNVLVGAPGVFSEQPLSVGEAYLFDAGTGALLQTFVNPAPEAGTLFGTSVAAVGGNVLVGAPQELCVSIPGAGRNVRFDSVCEHVLPAEPGAAYLFDGQTGALLQTFANPNPSEYDPFGESVASVGGNVVIGAPDGEGRGKVYIFDAATGGLLRALESPNTVVENGEQSGVAGDGFGASLAVTGESVLVGAPFEDTGVRDVADRDVGAAYLFDAATGKLLHIFQKPAPDFGDYFGWSVAAGEQGIAVGAPQDETAAYLSGAVYLFLPAP